MTTQFNVGGVYKQGLENAVSTSQILARLSRIEERLNALTRDDETGYSDTKSLFRQASKLELGADHLHHWSSINPVRRYTRGYYCEDETGYTPIILDEFRSTQERQLATPDLSKNAAHVTERQVNC